MASPPRLPPTKDDYVGSPSSVRKVSDAETLRALAQLDSERGSPPPPAQTTPQPSRRRSMKDRTPRQVQAVLSARKSRTNASGKKPRPNKQLNDQTPMDLLRAMSRMVDMPPPTPDEEHQDDGRRDSMASGSGAKMLTELDEEPEDESGDEDDSLSYASGSEAGSVVDHEPDGATQQQGPEGTPAHPSSAHTLPSSSTGIAGMLGLHSYTSQPLPPQPVFGTSAALASGSRSDLPRAFDDDERPLADGETDPRRMSAASSWSVEKARRESRATSAGDGSPGGQLDGDNSFFDRGSPGAPGRLSGVSLDAGVGDRSKTFLDSPDRTGRYSDFGNLSANLLVGADEIDDGLRRRTFGSAAGYDEDEQVTSANLFGRRDSVQKLPYSNDDEDVREHERVGYDTEDFGATGPVGAQEEEFDDADRIPWGEKGKNVAIELDEDMDLDQGGDFDEAGAGQRYEGMGFSDDEAPVLKHKMPKPPTLAKTAANRKKRVKKQRYTSAGDAVGELPKKLVKSLFLHYLGPNVKLEDGALEAVMDASHEYFEQMTQDAAAYAKHAGRKTRLHEADLVTMMYRQRVLTDKCGLQALGRQHGLDRELQGTIDAMGPDGKGVGKGKKGKRKAGDEQLGGRRSKSRKSADGEDGGSDDEADESGEAEEADEDDDEESTGD